MVEFILLNRYFEQSKTYIDVLVCALKN